MADRQGDDRIVEATVKAIDQRSGDGVAASQSWGARNTIRDMVNRGLPEAWAKGPILADAVYPDVIVGRAVTDGTALELVLHPGAGTVRSDIGLDRRTLRAFCENGCSHVPPPPSQAEAPRVVAMPGALGIAFR